MKKRDGQSQEQRCTRELQIAPHRKIPSVRTPDSQEANLMRLVLLRKLGEQRRTEIRRGRTNFMDIKDIDHSSFFVRRLLFLEPKQSTALPRISINAKYTPGSSADTRICLAPKRKKKANNKIQSTEMKKRKRKTLFQRENQRDGYRGPDLLESREIERFLPFLA